MPEQRGEQESKPDLITIGGVGYRPGTVGYSLAAEIMRLDATVKRVGALADEWAEYGPSLVRNACSGGDVHEGQALERCAHDLRAALNPPACTCVVGICREDDSDGCCESDHCPATPVLPPANTGADQ